MGLTWSNKGLKITTNVKRLFQTNPTKHKVDAKQGHLPLLIILFVHNKKEPRVSRICNMRKTLLQRVFCGPKMTQRLLKASIHRTITAPGLSEFLPSPGVTGLSWASPPIVVEKAGCAGAQASLALLCSWGIWHAKQPDRSLSLFL